MSDLPPTLDPSLQGAPAPWYSGFQGIDPAIAAQMDAYGAPPMAPDGLQPMPMAQPSFDVGPLEAPAPMAMPTPVQEPMPAPVAPLPLPVQGTTPEANGKVIVRDENGQTELITPQEAEGRAQQWDKLRATNAEAQTQAQNAVYKQANDNDAAMATKQAADWEVTKGELQRRQMRYDQDVDDLAKHGTVDSEAWWKSRSAGQQFAAIFSAAAAGFLQGTKGGSNTAIDAMSKAIDQNIQAQEATLSNKRAAVGLEQQGIDNVRAAGSADWEHTQAMRDAAWKGVELKAKVALASVNPAGVQAANLQQVAAGAQQQRQAIALGVQQKRTQIAVEDHTMKNQDAILGESVRARKMGERKESVSLSAAGYDLNAKGEPIYDAASHAYKMRPGYVPPTSMEQAGKNAEAAGKVIENSPAVRGVGGIKLKNGEPLVTDAKRSEQLQNHMAALNGISADVREMQAIRARSGYNNGVINNEDHRRLKELQADVLFKQQQFEEVKRLTAEDIEKQAESFAAGVDINGMRDTSNEWGQFVGRKERDFNEQLRVINPDVQKYEPTHEGADALDQQSRPIEEDLKIIQAPMALYPGQSPDSRAAVVQARIDAIDQAGAKGMTKEARDASIEAIHRDLKAKLLTPHEAGLLLGTMLQSSDDDKGTDGALKSAEETNALGPMGGL